MESERRGSEVCARTSYGSYAFARELAHRAEGVCHEVIPQGDNVSDRCGCVDVGDSTNTLICVYLYPSLRLLQPMRVQERFIIQNFLRTAVCHDQALVHHDRAREEFFYQFHIMGRDQHGDRQVAQ